MMVLAFVVAALVAVAPEVPVPAAARAVVDDLVTRSNADHLHALALPAITPALADSLIVTDHACAALEDLEGDDDAWCPRGTWTAYTRRLMADREGVAHRPWTIVDVKVLDGGVRAQLTQTRGTRREVASLHLREVDGAWLVDVLIVDVATQTKAAKNNTVGPVSLHTLRAICALPPTPLGPRTWQARHRSAELVDGGSVFAQARAEDRQTILRGIAHAWGVPCPFAEQRFVSDGIDDDGPVIVPPLPPLRPVLDHELREEIQRSFGTRDDGVVDTTISGNVTARFTATKTFVAQRCPGVANAVTFMHRPLCGPASVYFAHAMTPDLPQFDGRTFGAPFIVAVTPAPPLPTFKTAPWSTSAKQRVRVQIAARYLRGLRVTQLQEWQRDDDTSRWQLDRVLMPPPSSAFLPATATRVAVANDLVALCASSSFTAIVGDTPVATYVRGMPEAERRAGVESLVFLQGLERCPLLEH